MKRLALAAAGLVVLAMMVSSAQAGHRSYRWRGPRVGCPGEDHIIAALDALEHAYWARHDAGFHAHLRRACRQVRQAIDEVCTWGAEDHLWEALRFIRRARVSHDPRDLDAASAELVDALGHEQRSFQPAVVPRGPAVVVPAPVPVYVPRGHIVIQGRRFGIHFDF